MIEYQRIYTGSFFSEDLDHENEHCFAGAGEVVWCLRALLFLQRIWVPFPAPTSRGSQLPDSGLRGLCALFWTLCAVFTVHAHTIFSFFFSNSSTLIEWRSLWVQGWLILCISKHDIFCTEKVFCVALS